MRQGRAAARNIVAKIEYQAMSPYKHYNLGLVVDLGGSDAVAKPLGLTLRGCLAKIVTRAYHLYALPTLKRRLSVLSGWTLAGKRPNDVSFGLVSLSQALGTNHAYHEERVLGERPET
jgi:NADH dehydrogenase